MVSESDQCERGVLNTDKLRRKLEKLVQQRKREQRREERAKRKSTNSLGGTHEDKRRENCCSMNLDASTREDKSKENFCLPPPEAFQDEEPLPPEDFRDESGVFDNSEGKTFEIRLIS